MAGLFDFKSAEQILQERRATTEQNRLQMLKDVSQGAKRPEVVRLGANLGYLLGKSLFGGKSEKEQLTEAREMGETTRVMEQADVGGEGSAQWDGEGSSYGQGVLDQAKEEEQRRIGLLPQDMQDAIGEERQAKQLEQAFQNVDMDDPKATAELVKLAIASGNNEAASLAVSFNKNALEKAKGTAPQSAIGKMIADRDALAANNPNDPRLGDFDRAIEAEAKGAPGTQVNVNTKFDVNKSAEELAKLYVGKFGEALEKGDAASETLYKIDVMRNIDFETGNFSETKFKVADTLQKFGIDLPKSFADIGTGQALRAMSEQMVNQILMAATGVQTEGDASRARKTIASLGDTPEAFQFKLNMMEGIALRERAKADFLREKVVGQKNKPRRSRPRVEKVDERDSTDVRQPYKYENWFAIALS